jgi:hypothetical protein
MDHRTRPSLPGRTLLLGAGLLLLAPALTRCEAPIVTGTGIVALNNTAPVARIRGGGAASIGSPLGLDGTSSYDPDGDEIIFHWTVDQKPEGSELSDTPFSKNGDRNAGTTTVVPDVAGVFVFALVVEDPDGSTSDSAFVIYEASSSVDLPIADAGPNRAGLEGEEICLDGAASYDLNAHPLTYAWELVSAPDASEITTDDLTTDDVTLCLTPDAPGSYAFSLVVDNGIIGSEPDFAFVAAGSTNQGPVAVAEVLSEFSCDFVVLTAASSTDPEDDPLAYQWDVLLVPPGSHVAIGSDAFDDANAVSPRFYADVPGEYTVQLVVNDGEDYSTPVFVEIDATPTTINHPPVVVTSSDVYYTAPGPTCSVDPYGACSACPNCPSVVVPLDALASYDPDEDPLTFAWEVLQGPNNTTLLAEEGAMTELALPGPPGSCTPVINAHQVQVRVTATDCGGATATGVVTIVYDCGP